jgi:hypothetical protein
MPWSSFQQSGFEFLWSTSLVCVTTVSEKWDGVWMVEWTWYMLVDGMVNVIVTGLVSWCKEFIKYCFVEILALWLY